MDDVNQLLRMIPRVDDLLALFDNSYNHDLLKYLINKVLDNIRNEIKNNKIRSVDVADIVKNVSEEYKNFTTGSLKTVVNATGIPVHTNLGRSPISEKIFESAKNIVCRYSNLEYDLGEGRRGDRYFHCSEYLRYLTGAEDALIVNNNAAAVFLILNTFAKNREVIVSRGELIEIGGSFRLPDVMVASGAVLKEVGTTNKTKKKDYTDAISEKTAIIMKSHTSNYKVIGFTEEVPLEDIAGICKNYGIISYYDAGSGVINAFKSGGCTENSIRDNIKRGIDLVSFSGDKLLGGPQAGIIVGKRELIKRLKENQLLRMLRVDKLTIAILQKTLISYIVGIPQRQLDAILNVELSVLESKAYKLLSLLKAELNEDTEMQVVQLKAYTGGGACPETELNSFGVSVSLGESTVKKVADRLKFFETPVICRIEKGCIIFDVRTIFEDQFETVCEGLKWSLNG